MQPEAKGLGEPIGVASHYAKDHATDDYVVKMSDEKQAVVKHEVGWWDGHEHTGHAPDHERDHEAYCPMHRYRESYASAIHGKKPVENFDAGRHRNDHGGDAEEGVHVGACTHGKEVMQPDHEGQHADRQSGHNH